MTFVTMVRECSSYDESGSDRFGWFNWDTGALLDVRLDRQSIRLNVSGGDSNGQSGWLLRGRLFVPCAKREIPGGSGAALCCPCWTAWRFHDAFIVWTPDLHAPPRQRIPSGWCECRRDERGRPRGRLGRLRSVAHSLIER